MQFAFILIHNAEKNSEGWIKLKSFIVTKLELEQKYLKYICPSKFTKFDNGKCRRRTTFA